MNEPQNKVALVTGASRAVGIGAAIARQLAQAGMDIFITYYRAYDHESGLAGQADEPHQLLQEIRAMGCKADATSSRADAGALAAPCTLAWQHARSTTSDPPRPCRRRRLAWRVRHRRDR